MYFKCFEQFIHFKDPGGSIIFFQSFSILFFVKINLLGYIKHRKCVITTLVQ